MVRYAFRLDRIQLRLVAAALGVYAFLAIVETSMRRDDGLTASLVPYLPLAIGVVWAAPTLAREFESGTAAWAWSMGIPRRRWLVTRITPMMVGAFVAGTALAAIVLVTQASWSANMTTDRITPALLAATPPATIAFCLFAVALGTAAASWTAKLVPAIAITVAGQIAFSYAVPVLTIALAPTRTAVDHHLAGHVISTEVVGGISRTTYVSNSSFWPLVFAMSAAVLLLALLLAGAATRRVASLPT